jgi:hypothetical protein
MGQPGSMGAFEADATQGRQHRLAPRRHITTLFALIANIQEHHGADAAAADAVVMRRLREQRVPLLNAVV